MSELGTADSAATVTAEGQATTGSATDTAQVEAAATGAPVAPAGSLSPEAFEALAAAVVAKVAPMLEDAAKKAVAEFATDLTSKIDALATQVETASPAAILALVQEAHAKADALLLKLRHWL